MSVEFVMKQSKERIRDEHMHWKNKVGDCEKGSLKSIRGEQTHEKNECGPCEKQNSGKDKS